MDLFKVDNLTYYYPEQDKPALRNIDFRLREGELVLLAGQSGCGKSTLLRAMSGLLPDFYGGRIGGSITYKGKKLGKIEKAGLAREVALAFQNPEQQLVMTTVEREIAFGLENLGLPLSEMKRRVAETLSLFGLHEHRQEAVSRLSGGQQQKVVLASLVAMQPQVLLLDEPTSQLDPLAAQEFLYHIRRLNQEWGIAVIMVEQRMNRCFHLADRVVIMEEGEISCQTSPREFINCFSAEHIDFLPTPARIFAAAGYSPAPLTVKEARGILAEYPLSCPPIKAPLPPRQEGYRKNPLLEIKKLSYAYPEKEACLQELDLALFPGEITVLLGENGAGKSTLLKNINGLLAPQRGRIYWRKEEITGKKPEELATFIGYLSQNPNDYLFNDTVEAEINFNLQVRGIRDQSMTASILKLLDLEHLAKVNPRDLSGGQRQRVALGTVLVNNPQLLLLDEPTRGLDRKLQLQLAEILHNLAAEGKSVLMVTHNVEFAAEAAHRIVLMSAGEIICSGGKREILDNSLYYAPQVNRIFRGLAPGIVTAQDALECLRNLKNRVV